MISSINMAEKRKDGFTLLELLIVISIIAILSVALVLVLDPAETLKKSRDSQRLSDLSTMKTAIALYLTSTTTPYLGAATAGALNNTNCKATPSAATAKVMYSLVSTSAITDTTLDAASASAAVQVATPSLTNGAGWIPVMFDNLTGGSPISNMPLDPVNTVTALGAVASTDLVYRYACSVTPLAFELGAQLESIAYTSTDNKKSTDGGNNDNYYEVGTNLRILDGATNQY